jgi:glycosyltransferase involved in cell wall biosynthesis
MEIRGRLAMNSVLDLSIVFATCRRADTLQPMLDRMCMLNSRGISWEILIVDNADDPATRALAENYTQRLPVHYSVETRPGKNFALNSVVDAVRGDLVLFTDDDILPEVDWLQEVKAGTERWPDCNVFGGRILPHLPDPDAKIPFEDSFFMRCAYVIADWDLPEGYYPEAQENGCVWGPNMVIRRCVFDKGYRFNTSVGPNGTDYIMGSETELTGRLFKAGMKAVYLPGSLVYHQIRKEQLDYRWLCGRYYRFGRYAAYRSREITAVYWFGVPRYLYKSLALMWIGLLLTGPVRDVFRRRYLEYKFLRGQIDQFRLHRRSGIETAG